MGKFLIIGCGDIGSRVGNQLLDQGHQVSGLKRQPPHNSISPPSPSSDSLIRKKINYIQADLTSHEDIQQLDTDYDQVIYIVTPDGRSEKAYRDVYETGVNNLLRHFDSSEHVIQTPFIFVSSTRVYGQQQGEWVDENAITNPTSNQGKVLLAAEQKFLDHNPHNTIVRFSGIYGRSPVPFFMKQKNEDGFQHTPPYYTNRIHYTDCVNFLVYLVRLKNRNDSAKQKPSQADRINLDSIFLVSDDAPAPLWEVVEFLWPTSTSKQPLKKIDPSATQNKRCSNKRMKSLGYELLIKSYREGYTA